MKINLKKHLYRLLGIEQNVKKTEPVNDELKQHELKIYQFNVGGESEWLCAHTVFEALKFYHSLNDLCIVDFENEDDIIEIPRNEWKNHNIVDFDEMDDDGNYKVIETFEECMKGRVSADIIASTAR